MIQIFPSLISGDILGLRDQIKQLDPFCAGYHLDIMDGHFVPNITWGPIFINAIAQVTTNQLWIHMMVTDPALWLERLQLPAKSMIDFHIETDADHQKLIASIKQKKMKAGIAISPKTPLSDLNLVLSSVDYILVMSVNPGFSGQQFIPDTLERMQQLMHLKKENGYGYTLAADGGVNATNIRQLIDAGATQIAMASGIFAAEDPVEELQTLSTF